MGWDGLARLLQSRRRRGWELSASRAALGLHTLTQMLTRRRSILLALTLVMAMLVTPRLAWAVVSDTDIHFRFFKVDRATGARSTLDAAQLARQFAQPVCLCQEP